MTSRAASTTSTGGCACWPMALRPTGPRGMAGPTRGPAPEVPCRLRLVGGLQEVHDGGHPAGKDLDKGPVDVPGLGERRNPPRKVSGLPRLRRPSPLPPAVDEGSGALVYLPTWRLPPRRW